MAKSGSAFDSAIESLADGTAEPPGDYDPEEVYARGEDGAVELRFPESEAYVAPEGEGHDWDRAHPDPLAVHRCRRCGVSVRTLDREADLTLLDETQPCDYETVSGVMRS